ncbi:MAG: hypothetical protein QOK24_2791 [Verrucomicrobiota bacterium]
MSGFFLLDFLPAIIEMLSHYFVAKDWRGQIRDERALDDVRFFAVSEAYIYVGHRRWSNSCRRRGCPKTSRLGGHSDN